MAKAKSNAQEQIDGLVDYLRTHRETMLNKWRTVCTEDADLGSKVSFSREEFNNQGSVLLNILDQRLRGEPEESSPADRASEHGLHRWQRGYTLPELLAELEYLYWILLDDIKNYQLTYAELSVDVVDEVYRQVFKLFGEATRGSVLYFDHLRQTNAAKQANSMQQALDQLQELSEQRSEHLRQHSHDLRSNFGVLLGAATLLEMPNTDKQRAELVTMLNWNLTSIRDMLLQLTDFARIEAGQETVDIKPFDAALLLQETVETGQSLAQERKLILKGEGPGTLPVTGDAVKVQRILQNLLFNALKYTKSGGVYVSWAQENETRWILSVQDTGPGFPADTPTGLLAEQLKPLSQPSSTHQAGGRSEYPRDNSPSTEVLKKPAVSQMKESEGLGLFIVKKLCDLLKASMEIESAVNQGTLVRIRFLSGQLSTDRPA